MVPQVSPHHLVRVFFFRIERAVSLNYPANGQIYCNLFFVTFVTFCRDLYQPDGRFRQLSSKESPSSDGLTYRKARAEVLKGREGLEQ